MMHQAGCRTVQCRNSGHSTDAYGAALLHQLERELHGNSSYSSRADSENMQPVLLLEFGVCPEKASSGFELLGYLNL